MPHDEATCAGCSHPYGIASYALAGSVYCCADCASGARCSCAEPISPRVPFRSTGISRPFAAGA